MGMCGAEPPNGGNPEETSGNLGKPVVRKGQYCNGKEV